MQKNLNIHFYSSWPYDEALAWMKACAMAIKRDGDQLFLACGSHREQVITLGRHCDVPSNDAMTYDGKIMLRKLDRGGGLTAHEPGQLVLYPVFDLRRLKMTIPKLIWIMEESMIQFLHDLGLSAERSTIGPGVYIEGRKIGFVGMRIKDHISSHGLAINVLNNAKIFARFTPCGIQGLRVTSVCEHVAKDRRQPLRVYMISLVESFMHVCLANCIGRQAAL